MTKSDYQEALRPQAHELHKSQLLPYDHHHPLKAREVTEKKAGSLRLIYFCIQKENFNEIAMSIKAQATKKNLSYSEL